EPGGGPGAAVHGTSPGCREGVGPSNAEVTFYPPARPAGSPAPGAGKRCNRRRQRVISCESTISRAGAFRGKGPVYDSPRAVAPSRPADTGRRLSAACAAVRAAARAALVRGRDG